MKLTLSWLKEYLDTDASVQEIVDKLTAIGLEVDSFEDQAAVLKGFVVGEIVEAEKHPDSDHLNCLIVDNGKDKLEVVCGAPNARKGLKGIFAPTGSYIPGIDVVLKKATIRGKESNGMMCSERELCISDEHNGIIELKGDFKTGSSAAEALGLNDVLIEIELTPDRGDCTGVYGIARDLAAAGMGKLKPLSALDAEVKGSYKSSVSVDIKDSKACNVFAGRYIKGVKNGPSPKWMQDWLKAVGQRPISALVDITNFFTIAFGRPLHVYDADKLKGNIHVRFAHDGEEILALDENTYKLCDIIPAICDDSGVIGLGGIMGGETTGTDENTKNVFLECAYFDPVVISFAGQKLQIVSDARYRFERGVDAEFVLQAERMAAKMILDLCGGDASEQVVAGKVPDITRVVEYRTSRPETLGGVKVELSLQKEILENLGFKVDASNNDMWKVKTPSWRHDIDAGEADIVEEVLRIVGFDKIPYTPVIRNQEEGYPKQSVLQSRIRKLRHVLSSVGLYEAVTWSFMAEDKADLFGAKENPNRSSIVINNPISADLSIMRPSAIPNLIDAIGRNADRGFDNVALFEIARNFNSSSGDNQPIVATAVRSANAVERHWSSGARKVDAIDAKTDLFTAIEACGINTEALQLVRDVPKYYHPGRSGAVKMGKNVIGYFGEIHPGVLQKMGRKESYVAFELMLENLPEPKKNKTAKPMLQISSLQPLFRDFAFTLDSAVEVAKVMQAIKAVDKKLITDVNVFDIYTGKGVEDGKKSIALSVTIQPIEKTLVDKEIADICAKIIEAVEKQTGGKLRA